MVDEENKPVGVTLDSEAPHACQAIRVSSSCVSEEVARNYITEFDLKVHYRKELQDGTPRRIWEIYDPSGHIVGSLYTARGAHGIKNTKEPWKDIFDFAEFMVDRDKWNEEKFEAPETPHFKPHNVEGDKKV